MIAAYANAVSREDPLSCLTVGEIDESPTPEDWVTVHVKAASLNGWCVKASSLQWAVPLPS